MKLSHRYMEIGADVIYGGNWSYKWSALREENIPINSHVGLVPSKATWIGGFRAIGKTADEAVGVLKTSYAGAIGLLLQVAEVITKKVEIMTLSMGSGSGCDGQYLFANDIF